MGDGREQPDERERERERPSPPPAGPAAEEAPGESEEERYWLYRLHGPSRLSGQVRPQIPSLDRTVGYRPAQPLNCPSPRATPEHIVKGWHARLSKRGSPAGRMATSGHSLVMMAG
jgi:hypothetical protein